MTFHLNSSNPVYSTGLPANTAAATVASAGSWSGSIKIEYGIKDESGNLVFATYEDGEFAENFSKVFHPAANIIRFTFSGSGDAHVNLIPSRIGSRS